MLFIILYFLLACCTEILALLDPDKILTLDTDNDEALLFVQRLRSSQEGWTSLSDYNGALLQIHKRSIDNPPSYLSETDRQACRRHECIRAVGIVDASPRQVFELLQRNDKILEFNENCEKIRDLHRFPIRRSFISDSWSKIAWSKATPRAVPFVRSREFFSIVTFTRYINGTHVIINRPAYVQSGVAESSKCIRGSMLLAGNIIEPCGNRTRLTQILHINPGGTADTAAIAWIINSKQLRSYVYIRELESVLKRGSSSLWAYYDATLGNNAHPFVHVVNKVRSHSALQRLLSFGKKNFK